MGAIKNLHIQQEDYFLTFLTKEYTNCAIFLLACMGLRFLDCPSGGTARSRKEHVFDEKGYDIIWDKYKKESNILFDIIWKHFIFHFEEDTIESNELDERKQEYHELFDEWLEGIIED